MRFSQRGTAGSGERRIVHRLNGLTPRRPPRSRRLFRGAPSFGTHLRRLVVRNLSANRRDERVCEIYIPARSSSFMKDREGPSDGALEETRMIMKTRTWIAGIALVGSIAAISCVAVPGRRGVVQPPAGQPQLTSGEPERGSR